MLKAGRISKFSTRKMWPPNIAEQFKACSKHQAQNIWRLAASFFSASLFLDWLQENLQNQKSYELSCTVKAAKQN
jgi:hypothetical protein